MLHGNLFVCVKEIRLNPQYEIIEQIYRLDIDAGQVSQHQKSAQRKLAELSKKSKLSEELLHKSRNEMGFHETEMRRLYKRFDELEDRKTERTQRLAAAKTDSDHKAFKRDMDNVERDIRDLQRKIDEIESKIEQNKATFQKAENDLKETVEASADERQKAQSAEENSAGRLGEIQAVRDSYMARVDDRIAQHYARVSQITRNANGPICRVIEGACGNCRIGLSPQILNTVNLGKAIEFCPNCSHILLPGAPH